MRWHDPVVRDDRLPHQIRITTDSYKLYVSCNCLGDDVIAEVHDAFQSRVYYDRWHRERGIKT